MIPDSPLTLAQMGTFWGIVAGVVLFALILGDAITRGRQ